MAAGLLVGVQLLVFARTEGDALPLLWQGRQWFRGPPRTDVAYLSIAAARNLEPLAALIPSDARVLLVTPSPFVVPYDFYFAPRPLAVLMRLDPTLIEKAAASHPGTARQAERWLAKIEERGQALTAERLRQELPRADYVVTFLADAAQLGLHRADLLPPGSRLHEVDQREQAMLYRLERP
ncbi:MAG TPA: hypothetical protein VFD43_11890 [Planctomycetota bacterium]|nr:hypothetical protein [Planctomycetota bacterium]